MQTIRLIKRCSAATFLIGCLLALVRPLTAQTAVPVPATPQAIQSGLAQPVGPYDPEQVLRVVIALRPPFMQEEEEFLRQLQDPGSPHFHQFLSEAEWNARFAPSLQDEQALVLWAQSQGLTVSQRYRNRLLVDFEAPVAVLQRAFNVGINTYQVGDKRHFSNDRDPSLPAALASTVQAVLGLNDIEVVRTFSGIKSQVAYPVYSPGPVATMGTHLQGSGNKGMSPRGPDHKRGNLQSGQDGPYDPIDISSTYAYNYQALQDLGHCCNPLNNPGNSPPEASIAIAIWGDFNDSDISFWAQWERLTYNVQRHHIDGTAPCCEPETTLDTEWTTAMANSFGTPANTAEIHVYEGVNDHISTLLDVLSQILSDGNARVVNMSWGEAEKYGFTSGEISSYHNVFNQMAGQGWTLVASSGDGGSTADCQHVSVSYPASDPDVTAVGGTSLNTDRFAGFSSEVAWSGGPDGCSQNDGGSGGGCSVVFSDPGYQGQFACSGGMRSVPDLALNSDYYYEPQNFYYQGYLEGVGGTSIAAPEVSGFFAQENAYLLYLQSLIGNTCGPSLSAPCAPLGSGNPFLYREGSQQSAPHYPFYDITSGCNNNDVTNRNGLTSFCAHSGYDRVTGWGSANMLQLAWTINYFLASDGNGPPASFSGPATNHWYNTDQTVSWTLSDSSGNGHQPNGTAGFSVAWDADPGDPYGQHTPGAGNSYYGPQSYAASGSVNGLSQLAQGCHNAYVRAWDNAGNSARSVYGPLCYDTIPPVTTATWAGNLQQDGSYDGPVQVTLAASDTGSGIAAIDYSLDGGNLQTYSAPFNAFLPGFHQVTAYSLDLAGNQSQYVFSSFTVEQNQQFTLTADTSGTGGGTVTSSDGAIHCGTSCSGSYWDGQPVTLTAAPALGSVFIGWRNCDQSLGLSCTATITSARTITAVFNIPVALQFVPVTPCRVVDTRGATGQFGGPVMAGGTQRDFPIPVGPCPGIPSNASAYALNFTAVPRQTLNFLTAWATGLTQPLISTLNSGDGRVKANAAVVTAGDNQSVSVYVTDTTDVIIDINGYFIPSSAATLAFFPLTPCRVVDTRGADGPLGGPYLPNQQTRDFPVLQAGQCSIPASAQAYSMNFTAIPRQQAALGYLSVWPSGQSMPVVSTLNAPTGTVTANAAIVPAGQGGDIQVYPYGADTDLLIDIDGYFAPASSGTNPLSLYAFSPCRVLDTRSGGGAFSGVLPVNVAAGACQVPNSAQGYVMNATVVPTTQLGYLTLWPDGQTQPVVSTLNAYDGAVTSNMAIVPTANGSIDAYASDLTQLILDISSYFAP